MENPPAPAFPFRVAVRVRVKRTGHSTLPLLTPDHQRGGVLDVPVRDQVAAVGGVNRGLALLDDSGRALDDGGQLGDAGLERGDLALQLDAPLEAGGADAHQRHRYPPTEPALPDPVNYPGRPHEHS